MRRNAALTITPDEDHEFQTAVAAGIREHFGEREPNPVELDAFIDDMIKEVEDGWVIHRGQWRRVLLPNRDPGDVAGIAAEAKKAKKGFSRGQLTVGIGGIFLLLWVAVRLLSPDPDTAAGAALTPTPGTPTAYTLTATPDLRPTSTPLPAPTIAAGFITANGATAWKKHPNSLKLAGRTFGVYQAPVQQNVWQVVFNPGLANWVQGATLNWSFAIYLDADPDPSTGPWLAGLLPGEAVAEISVVEPDQHPHWVRYGIMERKEIDRTQTDVFDPARAGVTIALKADPNTDKWIELHGVEVVPAAGTPVVTPAAGKGGGAP